MNPLLIFIVLLSTLLAIGFITALYGKLHAERAKRIEAVQQLMEARAERDEWQETSRHNLECWRILAKTSGESVAAFFADNRKSAEQIDSLMNGDRRCVEHHRYHSGQGVSCPHCQAAEVDTFRRCQCGQPATMLDNGEWLCRGCYIPF